jgi:hypothetical protein
MFQTVYDVKGKKLTQLGIFSADDGLDMDYLGSHDKIQPVLG